MKKQVFKNRLLHRISLVLFVMLIVVALIYSSNRSDKNNRLISEKELVKVLYEIYVADGLLSLMPVHELFSSKDSVSSYIDIIQRHGYTKERMDNTIRFYFEKNPKKLGNIYDQVLTKLSEKQVLLEKEKPSVPKIHSNLWNGPASFSVPESGIKDPVSFSIPIKDTGNYILDFTTVVYSDDQSLNPKVTVFFWHADSSKKGFRIDWPFKYLPKDGQRHKYALSKRNTNPSITYIKGWLLDCDPKEGHWEKHAKIERITLRKIELK
jgi:hypothetical protein